MAKLTRITSAIADFEPSKWVRRSSLADGFILKNRDTVLLGDEGEYYMWLGELPHAVQPGTNPTGNPLWVNVGNGEVAPRIVNVSQFLTEQQMEDVRMHKRSEYVSAALQKAADAASRLGAHIYAEAGTYMIDYGVKIWSGCKGIIGDGAIFTTDKPIKFKPGTTEMEEVRPSPFFRMMGGSIGWQIIRGCTFDGNCKNLNVPVWPDVSQPNQTYYGLVELVTAAPYIFKPEGQQFDADHGVSYMDHTKKTSGVAVIGCNFLNAPGSCLVGNFQNMKVTACNFTTWYDHAVYAAGSIFSEEGRGILSGDIVVSNSMFKNRDNNRGNSCIKARCGVSNYVVIGNNFDTLDSFVSVGSQQSENELLRCGNIVISGNTGETLQAFIWLEANDNRDNAFHTKVNPQIVVANNTVKCDRFLTAGGSDGGSILRAAQVLFDANVVTCRLFASQYAALVDSTLRFTNNVAICSSGIIYGGIDDSNASNSTLAFIDNKIQNVSLTAHGYIHLVGATKYVVHRNDFGSIGFNPSSRAKHIEIVGNTFDWFSGITDKVLSDPYGSTGDGLSYFCFCDNILKGGCGKMTWKFAQDAIVDIGGNKFLDVAEGIVGWYGVAGSYFPRKLMFHGNYVTKSVFDSVNTAILDNPKGMFIAWDNTFEGNVTSAGTNDLRLITDNGNKAWLTACPTIIIRDNVAHDVGNLLYMINIVVSYSGSGQVYNYNNAMIGVSQFTCLYQSQNKKNAAPTKTI